MAEEKRAVLIRLPADKVQKFEDRMPWHGSMTQFFHQCLDEYLALTKNQELPADLTRKAVGNVVREKY